MKVGSIVRRNNNSKLEAMSKKIVGTIHSVSFQRRQAKELRVLETYLKMKIQVSTIIKFSYSDYRGVHRYLLGL